MNYKQMDLKPKTPKVGVGVVLVRPIYKHNYLCHLDILLGLRTGSHGANMWSLPGGHMEIGETFDDVCKREVEEETGIKIHSIKKIGFTNDDFKEEGLHYVTLFFKGYWDKPQSQN